MLLPDPVSAADPDAALALVLLRRRVQEVHLPPPALPGWQSLAATEYARAVLEVRAALSAAATALDAASAAS